MKIIFVLDNVRSAFNVGSIFRTADGLGAEVHLIGITPIPGKDSKLEKTSLSSLEYVPWQYFNSPQEWVKFTTLTNQKSGKHILTVSIEESKDLKTISLFDLETKLKDTNYEKIYLIFGHEISGVSELLQNTSDFIVSIPMYGKKNSLNIATCVGIVGYRVLEAIRHRDDLRKDV